MTYFDDPQSVQTSYWFWRHEQALSRPGSTRAHIAMRYVNALAYHMEYHGLGMD